MCPHPTEALMVKKNLLKGKVSVNGKKKKKKVSVKAIEEGSDLR